MRRLLAAALALAMTAGPALAIPPLPPYPTPPDARFRPADETDPALFLGDYAERFIERRVDADGISYLSAARPFKPGLCAAELMRMMFSTNGAGARAIWLFVVDAAYMFEPAGGCAAVPRGAAYFAAYDSDTAWRGAGLLDDILRQRDTGGRRDYPLGCYVEARVRASCPAETILATLRREDLRSINPGRNPGGPPEQRPHLFMFSFEAGQILEVTTRYKRGASWELAGTYRITGVRVFSPDPSLTGP